MVSSPNEWLWSSLHCVVGNKESPCWLATDALLNLFSSNRTFATKEYIEFVQNGEGVTIWDNLQHQVFLGDVDFIDRHQTMQNDLTGNLREIPLKQRRIPGLSMQQYQEQSSLRNEAIVACYESGSYTLNQISEYFGLHYSRVSRIVAKSKI